MAGLSGSGYDRQPHSDCNDEQVWSNITNRKSRPGTKFWSGRRMKSRGSNHSSSGLNCPTDLEILAQKLCRKTYLCWCHYYHKPCANSVGLVRAGAHSDCTFIACHQWITCPKITVAVSEQIISERVGLRISSELKSPGRDLSIWFARWESTKEPVILVDHISHIWCPLVVWAIAAPQVYICHFFSFISLHIRITILKVRIKL